VQARMILVIGFLISLSSYDCYAEHSADGRLGESGAPHRSIALAPFWGEEGGVRGDAPA